MCLKEALCQLTLHKEVLEDEKASLAQAITKVKSVMYTKEQGTDPESLID